MRETRKPKLPKKIKLVALVRSVRWIGWGFGEPLLPVFMALFARTFAEVGLLQSVYDIVLLFALPLIGSIADKYPARVLILAALMFYPLVGLGYFLAGVTGLAIFIVLARAINGVCWGFESTGVDTYYRRSEESGRLSTAFGYIDMVSNLFWMLAAVSGIWLVKVFPVHWLLFAVAPFSIISYFIARFIPKDAVVAGSNVKIGMRRAYRDMFEEFKSWGKNIYLMAALNFFVEIASALVSFFLPIYVYKSGGSLTQVILVAIAAALPTLFAYHLGKLADGKGEKRMFTNGLLVLVLSLLMIYRFNFLWVKIAGAFVIEAVLELFSIASKSYVTKFTPAALYGVREGSLGVVDVLGAIAGPLAIGISFDLIGGGMTFLVLAGISALIYLLFAFFAEEAHSSAFHESQAKTA